MASLPVINTPKHNLTIPSTGEVIYFRPYLVKEEKIILMAKESKDPETIIQTIKDIISACTFNKIKVENLSTFDIEYIFLNIRARSVSEIVELTMNCNHLMEDETKCDGKTIIKIDLTKIKVDFPEGHTKKIPLTDSVGVVMAYPSFDFIASITGESQTDDSTVFKIIEHCIDYIWDDDKLFYAREVPKEELTAFVDSLTSQQFEKIKNFIDTIPTLTHEVSFTCHKCKSNISYKFVGLKDFFI